MKYTTFNGLVNSLNLPGKVNSFNFTRCTLLYLNVRDYTAAPECNTRIDKKKK